MIVSHWALIGRSLRSTVLTGLLAALFLFNAYTGYTKFDIRLGELLLALAWPWVAAWVLRRQRAKLRVSLRAAVVTLAALSSILTAALTVAALAARCVGKAAGSGASSGAILLLGSAAGLWVVGLGRRKPIAPTGLRSWLAMAAILNAALIAFRLPRLSAALLGYFMCSVAILATDPAAQVAVGLRKKIPHCRVPRRVLTLLARTCLLVVCLIATTAIFFILINLLSYDYSL